MRYACPRCPFLLPVSISSYYPSHRLYPSYLYPIPLPIPIPSPILYLYRPFPPLIPIPYYLLSSPSYIPIAIHVAITRPYFRRLTPLPLYVAPYLQRLTAHTLVLETFVLGVVEEYGEPHTKSCDNLQLP